MVSFNSPPGWAFTESPDAMWWPELHGTKGAERNVIKIEIKICVYIYTRLPNIMHTL